MAEEGVDVEPYPPSVPQPSRPLIGREADLRRASDALVRDGHRIVTLVGTGGVGKTRLAIEVVRQLAAGYGQAVVFVPLAALADPAHVLPAIAQTIGRTVPPDGSAFDVLVEAFAGRITLLALDNVEHLPAVASEVADLVDAVPGLAVLTTSRVALRTPHEHVISIGPLSVPDPSTRSTRALVDNESVALLLQTIRPLDPSFELTSDNAAAIATICTRLEGLPLAIELAAARLRLLSPDELVRLLGQRLELLRSGTDRDGPPHHRTLRATIDWSYQLLSPEDQSRFRHLGVFVGGFQLQPASQVTAVGEYDLLDTLEQLVDHHLVAVTPIAASERRFDLLDTMREFAVAELAAAAEEAAARDAHADWCVSLAASLSPELTGADPGVALVHLDREHANLRAALAWLTEHAPADDDRALRLAESLWRYWWIRGHATEGRTWLDRALARHAPTPSAVVAAALRAVGELAEAQGDYAASRDVIERALHIFEELGDSSGTAECLNSLGLVLRALGDLDQAEVLHRRALDAFRALGNRRAEAVALNSLGAVEYLRGRLAEAEELWDQTVTIVREIGDRRSLGLIMGNLGAVRVARGDIAGSLSAHEEGLALSRELGDRAAVARALCNLGAVYVETGDRPRAEEVLNEALVLSRELGERYSEGVVLHNLGRLSAAKGDIAAAGAHQADGVAVFADLGLVGGVAGCQEHLAMLVAEHGRPEASVALFAAARTARELEGSCPVGADAEAVPRWTAVATSLVPDGVEDADRMGAGWTPAEAVAAARSIAAELPVTALNSRWKAWFEAVNRATGLTAREVDVARLLVQRRTDREIAAELFISQRTVTTHVSAVLRKLGLSSRREVAAALASFDIHLEP